MLAGYVACHTGDSMLLRAALRALREHAHHGRERLNPCHLERFQAILIRFEACEDDYHAARENPLPVDAWGLAR